MKKVNRQDTYICLECGKEFRGWLALPVWFSGARSSPYPEEKIAAYKCPYCRGKIKLKE